MQGKLFSIADGQTDTNKNATDLTDIFSILQFARSLAHYQSIRTQMAGTYWTETKCFPLGTESATLALTTNASDYRRRLWQAWIN
jgi:hypothetical protein